uniref:RdRp n=1 Tax=viral metagenome TaxID=1070528 RepID=A0A2V0RLL8_9ZZZZ
MRAPTRGWFGYVGSTDRDLQHLLRLVGGSPFLPDKQRAAADWRALVRKTVARRSGGVKRTRWDESWMASLQHKYRVVGCQARCPIGGGGAKKCLDLLWDLLGPRVRVSVERVFSEMGILGEQDNGYLIPLLKEMGDMAKLHGDMLFNGFWQYLVNWELCFGAPPEDEAAKVAFGHKVEEWLTRTREEDAVTHPRTKTILRGLDLLDKLIPRMEHQRTAEEWAYDPDSWLVNGASTEPGLPGTRSNKLSTFLARGPEGVLADLEDRTDPVYTALIKRERGKHRHIINAPWSLYCQQKFSADGMEDHLFKYVPSSLAKDFGVARWEKWRHQLGSKVPLPTDQSGFDEVPGAAVIKRVTELKMSKTALNCPVRMRVADNLRHRMGRGYAVYEGKTYPHTRGIISGWEWTSKMDTLISYAEALALFEEAGVDMPDVDDHCYQGDDAIQFLRGWGDVLNVVEHYAERLPVNPTKFFIDTKRTEFLRLVLTPERRFGYLARAVPSLVYANAWQAGSIDDPNALAESWSRIWARGGDPDAVARHMLSDIGGYLRLPREDVRDWLLTPKAVGGAGMLGAIPGGRRWLALDRDVEVVEAFAKNVNRVKLETLETLAQQMVWKTAGELLRAIPTRKAEGRAVCEHLCGGLVLTHALKKNAATGRYYLRSVDRRVYSKLGLEMGTRRMTSGGRRPPNIEYVGPRSLCCAAISAMTRWQEARAYVRHDYWDSVTLNYRTWPRKTWWQWVSGKLAEPSAAGWGMASDVSSWVKRELRLIGSWPGGRPSQERILNHHLGLEMFADEHLAPQFAHLRG